MGAPPVPLSTASVELVSPLCGSRRHRWRRATLRGRTHREVNPLSQGPKLSDALVASHGGRPTRRICLNGARGRGSGASAPSAARADRRMFCTIFAKESHGGGLQHRRRPPAPLAILLLALLPAVSGAARCIGEPAVLRQTTVQGRAVPLTLEVDAWEVSCCRVCPPPGQGSPAVGAVPVLPWRAESPHHDRNRSHPLGGAAGLRRPDCALPLAEILNSATRRLRARPERRVMLRPNLGARDVPRQPRSQESGPSRCVRQPRGPPRSCCMGPGASG